MRWTPDRLRQLTDLMAAGNSWAEARTTLCERWGVEMTLAQVRQAGHEHGIESHGIAPQVRERQERIARFNDAWRLTGDWVIVGDLQLPYLDWEMACQVAECGQAFGVRSLLIGGDVFDMTALSTYPAIAPTPTPDAQRDAGRGVIEFWRETFDEIRVFAGNHDWRLLRVLNGAFDTETVEAWFASMLQGAEFSCYTWCLIETDCGPWRVTHPRSYSRVPLSVARRLATKFQQNVICLHGHQTGIGLDDSGQYCAVSVGCLADPKRLAYVQLQDSASTPTMSKGFALLKGGQPHVWSDHPALAWRSEASPGRVTGIG